MPAFISTSPPQQVAIPPSDNPPPYSEELQEGHITLMKGSHILKNREEANFRHLNAREMITGGADTWNTSIATVGDVSLRNTAGTEPTSVHNSFTEVEDNTEMDEVQCMQESQDNNSHSPDVTGPDTTFRDSVEPFSNNSDHHKPETVSGEENRDILHQAAAIPPTSIHFYRPLIRSLSVDNSNLSLDGQLRVPNPRPQSMTIPAPLSTPFPPKATLPPLTRTPRNISPLLREHWVPKEAAKRPSRLPPLHRKRNRVATWHGESNFIVPSSESTVNTVHE